MRYDLTRLDGDLTYAPGITRAKDCFYWRPSTQAVAAGYAKGLHKLPGKAGDGLDLDRAARCRELTRDMLRWASGADAPKVTLGSWHYLIGRYKSDEFSPFHEVKDNSRHSYRRIMARLEAALGASLVADTNHEVLKRMERAMREKGRSVHFIKSVFTMLRILSGYGVIIDCPGAARVREILGAMRIAAPRPKQNAPTQDQVLAVIAAADRAGHSAFALGISLQWWLTLRAVDVRGQWLAKRWADGLTWDMVSKDMTTIRKVISKTARSFPDAITFDISPLADVRARLDAIPLDRRVGPVITDAKGRPYKDGEWARMWKKHAAAAGVPSNLKAMDIRSGALNHSRALGMDAYTLRDQAGHATIQTTEGYVRGRNDTMNRVIQLRAKT
jgi:integrase